MKKVAFIYPGQGSQSVGMGRDLYNTYPEVKKMFERADNKLGYDLSSIIFEGPSEDLTKTEHTQPALLLVSTVITELLNREGITPQIASGHSLGEYSALVAAGAISFEDAIKLVHERGNLMESAYPAGKGAMAAVLGLDSTILSDTLKQLPTDPGEVVELANINCPGQVVISGTKNAIEQAIEPLKEAGAKKVLPLPVSGPFHSSLMKPAAETFQSLIEDLEWSNIDIPVYANVTADKVSDAQEIKQLLVEQLYSPVRFEEIIEKILDESVDAIVEVGNGKVLTGLVKKVNRRTKTFTIQDTDSLQAFITWMKEEK